jgi:hypothetical protein
MDEQQAVSLSLFASTHPSAKPNSFSRTKSLEQCEESGVAAHPEHVPFALECAL